MIESVTMDFKIPDICNAVKYIGWSRSSIRLWQYNFMKIIRALKPLQVASQGAFTNVLHYVEFYLDSSRQIYTSFDIPFWKSVCMHFGERESWSHNVRSTSGLRSKHVLVPSKAISRFTRVDVHDIIGLEIRLCAKKEWVGIISMLQLFI